MIKRLIALGIIVMLLVVATPVLAQDVLVNAKIQDKVVAVDKNGNNYIRFIINKTAEVQGISYEKGVAVMAFSDNAKTAESFETGDVLKAICSEREYKGRVSYTILKILK